MALVFYELETFREKKVYFFIIVVQLVVLEELVLGSNRTCDV